MDIKSNLSVLRDPCPGPSELWWHCVPPAFRVCHSCSCLLFQGTVLKRSMFISFHSYIWLLDFTNFELSNILSAIILRLQKDEEDSVQYNESWWTCPIVRHPSSAPGAEDFCPCSANSFAWVPQAAFTQCIGMASG